LLLEDVSADADLVTEALRSAGVSANIRLVDQREEYLRALDELRPDIILADHALPEFKNADALQLARRRYPDVPFIFVSGAVGEELAIEAIKEGATDYVLKDHLVRLGPAVQRALGECRERRERLRSEETLRLILANALDAVATMDSSGLVTGWNPQAERIFGWSASEAVGRPLAELIIPERLRDAHYKGLQRYLAGGGGPILGRRVEMPAQHRDGSEFPVELTVTPIVQEQGTWFSAFIRDISGSKRMATRLSVEHAVAKILAEASEAEPALSSILEALARGLDWDVVCFWRLDPAIRALVLEDSWGADPSGLESFLKICRYLVFARDKGLPGRAWSRGAACWIRDLSEDDTLARISAARSAALRSGVAFPVREGGELLGVVEGYSRRELPPEPNLLEMLDVVGGQLGQFLTRKRSESASRATEQQLRVITNALPSLIAYVDQEQRYAFVNRAYEEWLGLPASAMLGKPVREILGEEVYRIIRPYVEQVLAGQRVTYEARLSYPKGKLWVEVNYVPDPHPAGGIVGFFSLVTDITPRKKAEESTTFLSEATGVLASSLDTETSLTRIARLAVPRIADWASICYRSDDTVRPLIMVHQDPKKVSQLRDVLQRFPFSKEAEHFYPKVLRTGRSELVPDVTDALLRTVAADEEHLRLLRELGLRSILTVPMKVGDRTIATLTLAWAESAERYGEDDLRLAEELARRSALAMENSRLYHKVRHESDERKRALEAVRDLNEHLEMRVRERTAKLEEITRELDAFASTVAHDLRAPLRVMKGFSELLLEDYSGKVLDPGGQEYAKRIDLASRRMSVLVEDLLAYSRLARQDVPLTAVDLGPALDMVLEDMAEELRLARGEVSVRPPLGRVFAHGPLLAQVLSNLVGNAVKFVAPGTAPRVTIRTDEDGGSVRLWVEDNGIGIPREHQERIFGVFERLQPQDLYPGTGLGLAIVRRAIERMGGTVGLESEVGRGSRFWIRLPRAEEEPPSGM
jgi:PAS domain S-box-containing protein